MYCSDIHLVIIMSRKNEIERLKEQITVLQNELAVEKKSAERMRLAHEAVKDGLWDYNVQEDDVYFSPGYYTMLGFQPYELPQSRQTWIDLLHPDDREETVSYVDKCVANNRSWSVEFRLRTKDGGYRWILGRGQVAARGVNGEVLRRVGTHTDITDLKMVEAQLKESEARYKRIFATIPSALWETDLSDIKCSLDELQTRESPDLASYFEQNQDVVCKLICQAKILNVNPAALALFEADNKAQVIEVIDQLFTTETISSVSETLCSLIESSRSISRPTTVKNLKGNLLTIESSIVVMPGFEQDWSRVLVSQVDITGLLHAQQQAESANRSKSIFLANMSHDLRTPINGIMGMLQLLQMEDLEDGQKSYVDMGVSSCRKLSGLLNDILDLSKIEAGKLALSSHEFSPDTVFRTINEMFLLAANQKGLQMTCSLDHDFPDVIIGDERRLFQILMNLIGNSIKFSDSGEIRISMEMVYRNTERGILIISVSDSGIGIKPEKLSILFEAFAQVDSSASREGAGLGLAIVKKLVLLMGGGICVESEEGVGTTFYVHIPVDLGERQAAQSPAGTDLDKCLTFQPFKVLVVEDDSVSGLVITTLLKNLGGEVDYVDSGRKALERLKEISYRIVFLDVQLPDVSGLEIVAELRTSPDFVNQRSTPVIAITANAMAGDRNKCLEAGMTDYLSKPLERDELVATLGKYL